MKRVIKFRALRDDMSDCTFKYGQLTYGVDTLNGELYPKIHESYHYKEAYSCLPNTEGQFTGLHDKNGVEIYEGDILADDYYGLATNIYIPEWENNLSRFVFIDPFDGDVLDLDFILDFIVIGNIHQNPELLK